MENQKNNSGLIALVIVLFLLVLGLGGYIVYDKVLSNKETSENQTIKTGENITTESTIEQRYSEYLKNLKNNLQKEYNNYDAIAAINSKSNIWNSGYTFTINKNFDLLMTVFEDKYKEQYNNYKIDSNVLYMNVISVGNGGYNDLYYITAEGNVKYFCIECIENGKPDIKSEEFSNIVSIVQGEYGVSKSGAWDPIFIDINGNTYSNQTNK